ncbi:hypothetical protein BJ138DRAFT_1091507 [Hygrophoropsis aurantiaca]|uniref:Uncharacterized protein n=1 Tax=Hygrophoropsis aurantiaca TaxID=72124 RepID=A0ACB8A5F8_9AGAM|nr:hypothetical protein BJ138DRAFT_1091507 [Hygrophoropsis aurantiaca]
MSSLLMMILDAFPELFLAGLLYPWTGVLIRWRANYTPRDSASEGFLARSAGRGPSYFTMLMKIGSVEGLDGLLKGILPTLAVMECWELLGLPSIVLVAYLHYLEFHPSEFVAIAKVCLLWVMISIPYSIIRNRAITTTQDLPYLSIRKAFPALLTQSERQRPYTIYTAPGLAAAHFAWTAFILIISCVRHFVFRIPFFRVAQHDSALQTALTVLVWAFAMVLNALILTPLEVAIVRLSTQGQPGESEVGTYSLLPFAGEPDIGDGIAVDTSSQVIQLRSSAVPYLSLADCLRRISEEEGRAVLYRGWWVTAFRGIVLL